MSLKGCVVRQTHAVKFNHVEGRNFLGMGRTHPPRITVGPYA